MRILHLLWQSIKHLNYRGYIYVWANLLWIALTLPIITAPAAWAGLMILTHRSHTRLQVNLDDLWDGFKTHFWRATVNGLITSLVLLINLSNLLTYTPVDWFGNLLAMVWFLTLIVWIGMQLYLWALIEEMEQPSLIQAYRNAFIMVIRNPIFTLILIVCVALIAIISIGLPPLLILLMGSSIAILGVSGALSCLEQAGYTNPEHHKAIEQENAH